MATSLPRMYQCRCVPCGATFPSRGGGAKYCDRCRPKALRDAADRKNAARRLATAPDPDERRRRNRASTVARYGLSLSEYDAMLAAQGGACAICGDPPKHNGRGAASRLHVDHEHDTGAVRALLCNHCNRGLGAFRDSARLLVVAAAYLDHHTSREG